MSADDVGCWCPDCLEIDARERSTEKCHYCSAPATTRDHIVPRALLGQVLSLDPRPPLVSRVLTRNTVPCCRHCNQVKGHGRSFCECKQCRRAWEVLGPYGWQRIAQVVVGQVRSTRTRSA